MDKNKLRKRMIEQLKLLRPTEKANIEYKLLLNLFNHVIWKDSEVIGATWSQTMEWNTKPIMEEAWKENKIICIPKSDSITKQLEFYQIKKESDLQLGYGNIMEPRPETTEKITKDEIELLIVPGIVFDRSGNRIGFGGGFYDRFLADFNQKTVSLVSKCQLVPLIPSEVHDIPVQFIITEEGCHQVNEK